MATYNLGQAAIVMKGVYTAGTAYLPLNCVTNDGGSWICKEACTGIEPGVANGWEEYWQPAASGIKEITITAASAGTATMVITFSDNTTTSFTYSTSDVADGSITNPKLALNSVGTNNLMNDAVTGPKIADGAVSTLFYVTFPASGWDATTISNTVAVEGVLASDTPIVDLYIGDADAETVEALKEIWGQISKIDVSDGSVTAYSLEMPTIDIPIKMVVILK